MTRKDFFEIITPFYFYQYGKKVLSLTFIQWSLLVYIVNNVTCKKSVETIVEDLEIGIRALKENKKALLEKGYIVVKRQFNGASLMDVKYQHLENIFSASEFYLEKKKGPELATLSTPRDNELYYQINFSIIMGSSANE